MLAPIPTERSDISSISFNQKNTAAYTDPITLPSVALHTMCNPLRFFYRNQPIKH